MELGVFYERIKVYKINDTLITAVERDQYLILKQLVDSGALTEILMASSLLVRLC